MPKYTRVDMATVQGDHGRRASMDLYIYIPGSDRYVRYFAQDEVLTAEKLKALAEFADPSLYSADHSEEGEFEPEPSPMNFLFNDLVKTPLPPVPEDVEVLGKATEEELKSIYSDLLDDTGSDEQMLSRIEAISDRTLSTVAPEIKVMRDVLLRNTKYLAVMTDSVAISSIAVMIALALGYSSRKPFQNLCLAAIIMDLALSELGKEKLEKYYLDKSSLDAEGRALMEQHPVKSYELLRSRIQSVTDVTMQLVLNHHELANGSGFPRGIRTDTLFPLARVLPLAVDVFEQLKRKFLLKEPASLAQLLLDLRQSDLPEDKRRHNPKTIAAVLNYYAIT